MKIESRGKYPGVKLHLEPAECQTLLDSYQEFEAMVKKGSPVLGDLSTAPTALALRMGKKIRDLMGEDPEVLAERTPEKVAAILVKEAEKASLQLKTLKSTGQFTELNKEDLKTALLKYVKE